MLQTPPLSTYSNYCNVFAISVPSAESGADHYSPSTNLVDTYFDARYDTSGIGRLLTISSQGSTRASALLQQFVPEYDIPDIRFPADRLGGRIRREERR